MTDSIVYRPIGIIHTPYLRKYDAPRQPGVDDREDTSIVELYPARNYEQALQDVDGCSHIWLLTHFHMATNWKPLVLPPRGRDKRGVFATRSPHRPNPIGLSCVALIAVSGRRLTVRGTDLLDGTPVLDIKPYVSSVDALVTSSVRWLDAVNTLRPYTVSTAASFSMLPQDVQEHVLRVLQADPLPHPYRRIEQVADNLYELAVREYRIRFRIVGTTVHIV